MDGDAGAFADVFIIAALVGILKPAPAADIVGQDGLKFGFTCLNLRNHPPQAIAAFHAESAFALVGEHPDNLHAAPGSVFLHTVELVLRRILLVLRGHSHVSRDRD